MYSNIIRFESLFEFTTDRKSARIIRFDSIRKLENSKEIRIRQADIRCSRIIFEYFWIWQKVPQKGKKALKKIRLRRNSLPRRFVWPRVLRQRIYQRAGAQSSASAAIDS